MADDSVILNLDANGENTIAVLDEIDAALSMLSDSIAAVADSAANFAALDDAMASLSEMTAQGAAGTAELDAALATVGDSAMAATDGVGTLVASLDMITASSDGAAVGAETAATSMETMGASAESAGGMLEGLQAAMGPLLMIGTIAAMVGGKLIGMGMAGQQGESLVQGMAGASTHDIDMLQQSAMRLGETMPEAAAGFYQVESAGYAGSQGINVLDESIKAAKASHSQLSDVTSVATGILHAYNLQASDVGGVLDKLIATTVQGKQSFGDLASAIGPLAAQGAHAHISLTDLLAAEAAMTQINPHVRQDTQQLTAIVKTFALGADATAQSAKKLGITFDEGTFKSKDFYGQLQYLRQQTEGNDKAFAKLVGGANGYAAAMDILQGKGQSFVDGQKNIGHSLGANDKAFATSEQTVSAHVEKISAAVSVMSTKLVDSLGPKLIPVIDTVSTGFEHFADFVTAHTDVLIATITGLAAAIGGGLVVAMGSLVVSASPVILIITAIAASVAGIVMAFEHWGSVMGAVNQALQIPAIHMIVSALQQVGNYIAGLFLPVWRQLIAMWTGELLPAIGKIQAAVQPIIPIFQVLGAIIGGVLVIGIGILIATISGLIKAFAAMLSGLITAVGGIIKVFTGFAEIIGGIVKLIVDVATGNFSKLGADLGDIMQGIGTMFSGIWQVITGIWQASIGAVLAYVSGFVTGIVGFFTTLWSDLVGHSIVPDMINGIVGWFEQLPGRAMSAVASLAGQISGFFGGLASQALSWGADLITNLAAGITGAIGNVIGAIGNVTGAIASHLHFTKPDEGELSHIDEWMPHMGDLLATGLSNQVAKIKAATLGITGAIASIGSPQVISPSMPVLGGFGGGSSTGGAGGNTQTNALLQQIIALLQQQQQHSGNNSSTTSVAMNNTIHAPGITNAQQLYNLLQSIGGFGYQDMQRGAYSP